MILPFDEWRPDLAPLSPGVETALNCLPVADGYVPMPIPVVAGPAGIEGIPQLLVANRSVNGAVGTFCLTDGRIYRLLSGSWQPIGLPTYAGQTPWAAARYGGSLYAVNGRDPIQRLDIEGGAVGEFPTPETALTGSSVAVVREFVVIGDVRTDRAQTRQPQTVRWSGNRRPETWEKDAAGTGADEAFMSDIGYVMGLVGGQFGLVLGQDGLRRMDFQGPPIPFRFETLETGVGCELARSIIKAGDNAYWWSKRGWRVSNGGPSQPIGVDKVDRYFRTRCDFDASERLMSAVNLPDDPIIMWAYVTRDSVDGVPDEVLAYNTEVGRWTRGRISLQVFGTAGSSVPVTDDPGSAPTEFTDQFSGLTDGVSATRTFPAVVRGGRLHSLQQDGSLEAEFTTSEVEPVEGRIAKVTRALPLVHQCADCDMSVQVRDTQTSPLLRTKGPYARRAGSGTIPMVVTGRFHRYIVRAKGFSRVQGVRLLELADAGKR